MPSAIVADAAPAVLDVGEEYLALEWVQENILDRVPFLRSGHMHHEADAGKAVSGKAPASAGAA